MGATALKTIVIVLAVLIFAAFGLIVWRIFGLAGAERAASFGDVSLGLPANCRIVHIETVDDRLAVLVDGPDCNAVYIVDPTNAARVGRLSP